MPYMINTLIYIKLHTAFPLTQLCNTIYVHALFSGKDAQQSSNCQQVYYYTDFTVTTHMHVCYHTYAKLITTQSFVVIFCTNF
jgi:hypothetical protein